MTVYEAEAIIRTRACCDVEHRYLTRREARRAARRRGRREIPYRCTLCRLWQLRWPA